MHVCGREIWLAAARKVFEGIGSTPGTGRVTNEGLVELLRRKLPAEEVESAVEAAMIDAGYAGRSFQQLSAELARCCRSCMSLCLGDCSLSLGLLLVFAVELHGNVLRGPPASDLTSCIGTHWPGILWGSPSNFGRLLNAAATAASRCRVHMRG